MDDAGLSVETKGKKLSVMEGGGVYAMGVHMKVDVGAGREEAAGTRSKYTLALSLEALGT